MAELPSGTVTFLLTDVEGSTALWERDPEAMRAALVRHDALFEDAIHAHRGVHIKPRGEGDSRFAVFASAPGAVAAALSLQRAFAVEHWPTPRPIKVRIGIHTGEAELRGDDYYGSAVNRCARLRGIGHGGQTLVSEATAALIREQLSGDASLLDLGAHRLKDLTRPERVFQLAGAGIPSDFPPLTSLNARPHNLPTHPTALLGRETEVVEVRALLRGGTRLVTLTGPGGTGKTRLGLQVAAELLDDFEHGVFFVDLAPILDPALVAPTIAHVLGLHDAGARPLLEVMKEYLGSRTLLLVLDNFEQIVAAAPILGELLAGCPGLKALVTSREPLRLRGEHEYAVPPLTLPEAHQQPTPEMLARSTAVALFVERAASIRTGFTLTPEHAPAVAQICSRLHGLPLAIELAAARVRTLTPQMVAGRLERGLSLLSGGARDLPVRQQTLRDTIAWSHDLLDQNERRLFRRLAVFVGGWTLDAAEAVCDLEDADLDILDGLDSLVLKSLVRRDDGGVDGPRFRMLETIREYALEQLRAAGDEAAMRRRHLDWCVDFAERGADGILVGPDSVAWLDAAAPERDNVRSALAWSLEDAAPSSALAGLRLAGAQAVYWFMRDDIAEGCRWLREILAANPLPAPAAETEGGSPASSGQVHLLESGPVRPGLYGIDPHVIGLNQLGMLAAHMGELAESKQALEEAITLAVRLHDRLGEAHARANLGQAARFAGDHQRALALGKEAVAIARTIGHPFIVWRALGMYGQFVQSAGDVDHASLLYEESLTAARRFGSPWNMAQSLRRLATVARQKGDLDRATTLLQESFAFWELTGVQRGYNWALADVASIELIRGDARRARARFAESLRISLEISERRWIAICLEGIAAATAADDDGTLSTRPMLAARLLGSAAALRAEIKSPPQGEELLPVQQAETFARAKLGPGDFEAAFSEGRAMSLEQAVAYALEREAPP